MKSRAAIRDSATVSQSRSILTSAPQQEFAPSYKASHREATEQCLEPDSKAKPWSRSILTGTIKIRSTARADLIFMAPATGIEPVTNP